MPDLLLRFISMNFTRNIYSYYYQSYFCFLLLLLLPLLHVRIISIAIAMVVFTEGMYGPFKTGVPLAAASMGSYVCDKCAVLPSC